MISIEMQKHFFEPVCNKQEIERIFNVQNAKDHLLKIRAETIVDHMRLFRVYRNKAIEKGESWSLEDSFQSYQYIFFKNKLEDDLREKCRDITFGNIFSNDANGLIFKTDYGIITTMSESLKYFFQYMNLGLLDFGDKVPKHVQINSIRIAIRVMLQTESLDFLMDPRGIIPSDIQKEIYHSVPFQMQFIAGHEYSHYLLGHLSDRNLISKNIFKAIFKSQTEYKPMTVFNTSQKHEFEADIASINLPKYSLQEKLLVLEGGLLWFACLDLYEAIEHFMFPPIGYQSHPTARERYFNLLEKVETYKDFDYEYWTKALPKTIDFYKKMFVEDISLNIEHYETYGSFYLDKPNTKWRGRELIDRVDYY